MIGPVVGPVTGTAPGGAPHVLRASLTYALLMGSLALLETARDATLVAADAVDLLPWAYVGVALAVVLFELVVRRLVSGVSRRRVLAGVIAIAAFAAIGAGSVLPVRDETTAALFYGCIAFGSSVVTSRYWALVASSWTVEDGKQHAASVSAWGVGGALVGSWIARAVVGVLGLASLGFVAAIGLVLSLASLTTWRVASTPRASALASDTPANTDASDARSARYLFLLFAFMGVGTIAMTATDFVFKNEVHDHVSPDELGAFFATFYGIAYAIGLFAQIFVSRRVLDAIGVTRVLPSHPAMFVALAGLAIAAQLGMLTPSVATWSGAYVVWIVLRGLDAALRYARYSNVIEVAHLAASSEALRRWRTLLDSLAQRAGQACAALLLLVLPSVGALGPPMLAFLASVVWLVLGVLVGVRYLALLADRVDDGAIDLRFESVALDLGGVEALLARLSSDDDRVVLGALETLAKHGAPTLVPTAIAYHPSPRISARALDLFSTLGRTDHVHVARRLLDSPHDLVRAAAGRAIAAAATSAEERAELATRGAGPVRIAALVARASAGELDARGHEELRESVMADEELALAFARAAAQAPSLPLTPVLAARVERASDELARELAFALARAGSVDVAPALTQLLASFGARAATLQAWERVGAPLVEPGFAAFDDALATPHAIRMQLPKALVLAGGDEAARGLLQRMKVESDPGVRYRMLVALGTHRAREGAARLPTEPLTRELDRTIRRAHRFLLYRHALGALDPDDGFALLRVLLENKHLECVERAFRLLGLLAPGPDYERLYDGLRRGDAEARAAAREVLRYATAAPRANAVAALVSEGSAEDRAHAVERAMELEPTAPPSDLRELFRRMLAERSEAVGALTLALLDDATVDALRDHITAVADDVTRGGAAAQARARLDRLAPSAREEANAWTS